MHCGYQMRRMHGKYLTESWILAAAQYFMDMDAAYEQACECESALESAVGAEAYQSAAASMEEYRELQAQDPVFGVLKVCT